MRIKEKEVLVILKKDELLEAIDEKFKQYFPMQSQKEEVSTVGEYISQQEAMKLLGRKATWFYNKRQSNELPAIKSGNSWWYLMSDIEKFIKNGRQSDAE